MNRYFFVLLSGDWYRATSRHWIIFVSSCLSTFTSLVRAISRHGIFLDSLRVFAFTSLVWFRLFSTFQTWAVWRKASVQGGITSSISFLFSWIKIFPGLNNFSGHPRNPRGHISHLRVAHGLASCLACHPRNFRGTSAEGIPVFCLIY